MTGAVEGTLEETVETALRQSFLPHLRACATSPEDQTNNETWTSERSMPAGALNPF